MYTVIVPLIQVATTDGVAVQVTKGGPVPSNITKEALANLIDLEYVEKVKDSAKSDSDAPAGDGKPTSVKDILKDVGDDKAKAQEYLDEENAAEKPRATLVEGLQAVLAAE